MARGDVGRFAVNSAVRWLAVTAALGWSSALLWGRWLAEFGWLPTSVALATATLSVLAVWSLTVWFTVDTLLAAVERALTGSARAGGQFADHLRSEGGRWVAGGVDWFVAAARDGLEEREAPPWVRGALPAVAVWAQPLISDGAEVGVDLAEAEMARRLERWRRRVRFVRRLVALPVLTVAWGIPGAGLLGPRIDVWLS